MNFYYKGLSEGGYAKVFCEEKVFLRVRQENYLRRFYTFYKDDKVIFKSRLSYFAFWRKVKILQQDLPEPIKSIVVSAWNETELFYSNTVLGIKAVGFFKKKMWLLYKNGFEIGFIEWAKVISLSVEYNFHIDDDETVNTYFLILFASSIPQYI